MNLNHLFRGAAAVLVLGLLACGQGKKDFVFDGMTPAKHAAFNVATGTHALDCAQCHGTYPSFKQYDCLTCHVQSATDLVHKNLTTPSISTAPGYAYPNALVAKDAASLACYGCHKPSTPHPYDHAGLVAGVTSCAPCHDAGAFYAVLPLAGFAHFSVGATDCRSCHVPSSWSNVTPPTGLSADPLRTISVNALVPRYTGTSIASVSPQVELLPMPMDHATSQVNVVSLTCTGCHATAVAGAFYPGWMHDSLANQGLPQPVACSGCHATSVPTGFVGPTATSPARTPASGEMKHDAVLWSAGVPGTTRLVTADCGVCHLSPSATVAATWSMDRSGVVPARYHASLAAVPSPQPSSCVDCHANTRPASVLTAATAALPAGVSFDHSVAAALADCAACHAGATTSWSGGRFHLASSANPTSCLPCHAGDRPTSDAGWTAVGYRNSPFDYGTNGDGIPHGDGQDCAMCHAGPGTNGTWGGAHSWTGGHFTHGPATVSGTTCSGCHMSQRPDLVLTVNGAKAVLPGAFDHSVDGPGDCFGCHQATVARGSYVNYFSSLGTLPNGDWAGGSSYPGNVLVGPTAKFVTLTVITLARPSPGAMVTGMTNTVQSIHSGMLHTSTAVPPQVSPGTSATGDRTTCWHCHPHDLTSPIPSVTSYAGGVFHLALSSYAPNLIAGTNAPLPQPTSQCADCHRNMRPPGIVELANSNLQPMDHNALFTGTVLVDGQTVSGVGGLDCSTCHGLAGDRWTDGTFHLPTAAATPADCVACHYPLMADTSRSNVIAGVNYAMIHGSAQVTFQACGTCHAAALAAASSVPYLASDWRTGAFHPSLASQPTGCVDCHAVSEPPAGRPTQSSWAYPLAAGGTPTNGGQWMNHGAATVAAADCVLCHATDAKPAGSAWSKADEFHTKVASPGSCQACHGLTNGGGSIAGTNNNLPAAGALTNSTMVTSAVASGNNPTGIAAGTHDQITHSDVNVTGHDCGFCHTQAGRSSVGGIQGAEWAQARFHTSFSATTPLVLNGTSGRCSNCHLNLRPGAGITAEDHSVLSSVANSQDCSACHSWPGTGTSSAPNWLGATNMPQFITVGGFTVPAPPAPTAVTQAGIANLPHPTVAVGTPCSTCHTGGLGGKNAIGYDHLSALIAKGCNACHEAGSNLLGTKWNGATTLAAGAGDTRPISLGTILARRGTNTQGCNINAPNHFYPTDCGECHKVPTGNGAVTSGTSYINAWIFPHTQSLMSNPTTCNKCHVGQGCST